MGRLFARFDVALRDAGYLAMGGQIVDATVVEARRPRLTKDEKATIRGGGVPAGWAKAKRAQMDMDGRWTIKRGRKRSAGQSGSHERTQTELAIPVFGYKNHLGIDRRHGFIRRFVVTDAASHDGRQLGRLARSEEHRELGLGRHGLPLGGQRRAAGAARAGAAVPATEATRQADATAPGARQRQ
jgi:Transposase DDE domain